MNRNLGIRDCYYIIRLKYSSPQYCWLCGPGGDPGRTLVENSAQKFATLEACEKEIQKVMKENPFRKYDRDCFVIERKGA